MLAAWCRWNRTRRFRPPESTKIPRPIQLPLARKLSPANQHTQCPMGPASHARSLATPPLPGFSSAPGVLLGCVLHSAGAVCGKGSARTRPTLTQKRDSPTNCRPYRPAARGTGGAVWEGTINWWRLWSQRVIVATGRHPGAAAAKTLRCRQTGGRKYIQVRTVQAIRSVYRRTRTLSYSGGLKSLRCGRNKLADTVVDLIKYDPLPG